MNAALLSLPFVLLAVLSVTILSAQSSSAPVVPIQVGQPFPTISGESLARTNVTVPNDFRGKVTLVSAAFVQPAQELIDTWAKPTLAKYFGRADFAYLELPILPKRFEFFGLGASWINNGMRSGIDPKLHASVVTLYTDLDPYYVRMGPDRNTAYIYLLDQNGTVVGRWTGAATTENISALHQQIDALMRLSKR